MGLAGFVVLWCRLVRQGMAKGIGAVWRGYVWFGIVL